MTRAVDSIPDGRANAGAEVNRMGTQPRLVTV
jgi:hypothetical protein